MKKTASVIVEQTHPWFADQKDRLAFYKALQRTAHGPAAFYTAKTAG